MNYTASAAKAQSSITRALFSGEIVFKVSPSADSQGGGAGLNVRLAEFDQNDPPDIVIEYHMQGGMPRIYMGTGEAPQVLPKRVRLKHVGESETAWIRSHPAWFQRFSN
jgi:hypothetical protein